MKTERGETEKRKREIIFERREREELYGRKIEEKAKMEDKQMVGDEGFVSIGEVDTKGRVRRLPIKAGVRRALCFPGESTLKVSHLNKDSSANPEEPPKLGSSNGVPMLYIYKEGNFIRKGSPLGSTEAGVYAYTWDLGLYRHKLDEMSN
ncbi:hypothetical protein LOK49_LG04G00682 [Camellia lanceoleosa]|uniref:Uncharacterized protein n=1 Tax=Camellia lanceoleosa TaxID=1840588 RepID=A0ACC0HW14_9ERIC|nr:hypothetical protein LOK49_LG04G00682 [Camellia lanceoleosa]